MTYTQLANSATDITNWWLWVVLAYGCGSIPFAFLIGKAHGVDIRTVGSGNVGATNLARALGKHWGWICFLLDGAKGACPVVAAGLAMGLFGVELTQFDAWKWLAVGVTSVLGHVFPIWLGFRGGKGVATGMGVLLGYWPILTIPAGCAALVWVLLLASFRYVSLASIAAAIAVPLALASWVILYGRSISTHVPFLITTALLSGLVVVMHWSNVKRLIAGTESKIGQPRS